MKIKKNGCEFFFSIQEGEGINFHLRTCLLESIEIFLKYSTLGIILSSIKTLYSSLINASIPFNWDMNHICTIFLPIPNPPKPRTSAFILQVPVHLNVKKEECELSLFEKNLFQYIFSSWIFKPLHFLVDQTQIPRLSRLLKNLDNFRKKVKFPYFPWLSRLIGILSHICTDWKSK